MLDNCIQQPKHDTAGLPGRQPKHRLHCHLCGDSSLCSLNCWAWSYFSKPADSTSTNFPWSKDGQSTRKHNRYLTGLLVHVKDDSCSYGRHHRYTCMHYCLCDACLQTQHDSMTGCQVSTLCAASLKQQIIYLWSTVLAINMPLTVLPPTTIKLLATVSSLLLMLGRYSGLVSVRLDAIAAQHYICIALLRVFGTQYSLQVLLYKVVWPNVLCSCSVI